MGKIDPGSASRYITSLVHAYVPGPVDSWKEFPPFVRELLFDMFMNVNVGGPRQGSEDHRQPEDPMAWIDYGPVWMRRDYWESLCHRWATGPWQEGSQAAERNRAAHPEKNVHTSGSISYATPNQKLDRTIADCYAEGTPQPNLDPEVWVDATGGPSVRLWGQPRYYCNVVLICDFGCPSGLCEFICCDAWQWWRGHKNPHLGRATAALWRHGRAYDLCHPRSRPLTGIPSVS
ncbi:hypothetical protein Taro_015638, partial [Colocasia esculenta]|nr:hypothetical protein [Colocasia esculenta]